MKFSAFLLLLVWVWSAAAQETQDAATRLPTVRIFGSDRATLKENMAPAAVSQDVIEAQQITDVNRALKQAPGVYVREEEGQGLRPNIGLRGTNPDRSKKVTLLEDGILIGPAPYSAPAAYYTPSMNHIEDLKIYKGFKATGIGPNSIGGAVDYQSIGIPSEMKTGIQSSYGSFGTWNTVLNHGGQAGFGSYMVNGSFWKSDGFKELDGGGDTGFEKVDVLSKLRFDLSAPEDRVHAVEVRFGYSHEDSHETYLGLSREDFEATPNRRYAASQTDDMKWNHRQIQLSHEFQPGANSLMQTDIYYHQFHRAWHRLDRLRDTVDAQSLYTILKHHEVGAFNPIKYDIIRGLQDSSALGATNGQLIVANNDRNYLSQGVQTRFSTEFDAGEAKIKPWIFARFHQDFIKRNHTGNNYEMVGGRMVRTADAPSQDAYNKESAQAVTLAAASDFEYQGFVLTPVMRWERVDFKYDNSLNPATNNDRESHVFLPGLSLLKSLGENFSVRVSSNEAATISGLSADGSEVKEEAKNYEAQLKWIQPEKFVEVDVTAFYMDYQNLTGTCSVSSGCSAANLDQAFDGGEAIVQGVELAAAKGFIWNEFFFPIQGSLTYLDARFDSDFSSSNTEWGADVRKGDPLPYIPEIQYSLVLGVEWKKLRQDLTFMYQTKVYDQADPADREEIDAFGVVDWSGKYTISKDFNLVAKVENILNREYAVAMRPFGLRPGKPQSFQAGFKYEF